RWSVLLVTAWVTTAAFAVALASTEGWSALIAPLRGEHEYLGVVPLVRDDPGTFLRTFTDRALDYPIHVRGHPPGVPLLLAGMDRVGLGGAGWAAALVVVVGTSAVVAVAITVRALVGAGQDGSAGQAGGTGRVGTTGQDVVRRALPAAVLAPAA